MMVLKSGFKMNLEFSLRKSEFFQHIDTAWLMLVRNPHDDAECHAALLWQTPVRLRDNAASAGREEKIANSIAAS
jgi:hypothetical protein